MIMLMVIGKKLSKFLSKRFKALVYWNEYKTNNNNKKTANVFRYFLEFYFVRVNRIFVSFFSNEDDASKKIKAKRY